MSIAWLGIVAAPDSASALRIPVEHVDGRICDVTTNAILYRDFSGGMNLEDRATQAVTAIPGIPRKRLECGEVSPHGAVFEAWGADSTDVHLWEYRDGALIDLGSLNSSTSEKVVGHWLIWNNDPELYRRDLDTGTTIEVPATARVGNVENDVDEAGNVFFWTLPDYDIFRFDGTTVSRLTNDTTLWNTYPLTDGTNVVYRKHSQCCLNDSGSVAFWSSGAETVLDSFRNDWPEPCCDYAAAGGWIAFTRTGAANELQVWLRSPSGVETRISPTGHNFQIVAVSPTGEVIYTGRHPSPGTNYFLGRPGAIRQDLGSTGGRFFWTDGSWYQIAGGSLYRIEPSPDPYPRPRGATPLRIAFTPAYTQCTSPNTTHGAPLAFGSCSPPQLISGNLTLGTPDANGKAPRSEGSLLIRPRLGNDNTWADEADVRLEFSYTNVFKKDLTDYTGELRPTVVIRQVDRDNVDLRSGAVDQATATGSEIFVTTVSDHGLKDGDSVSVDNPLLFCLNVPPIESQITVTGPRTFALDFAAFDSGCSGTQPGGTWEQTRTPDPVPATGVAIAFGFSVPCVATADTFVGSNCATSTTADSIVPGMVSEGGRAIWQVSSARVFDGGGDADGDTTADNTLFATEGIFVP